MELRYNNNCIVWCTDDCYLKISSSNIDVFMFNTFSTVEDLSDLNSLQLLTNENVNTITNLNRQLCAKYLLNGYKSIYVTTQKTLVIKIAKTLAMYVPSRYKSTTSFVFCENWIQLNDTKLFQDLCEVEKINVAVLLFNSVTRGTALTILNL